MNEMVVFADKAVKLKSKFSQMVLYAPPLLTGVIKGSSGKFKLANKLPLMLKLALTTPSY